MCVVEFALQREMQSRWVRRGDYKSAPGSACRFRFHHSTSRNEHLYRPRLAPNSGANLGHRSAVVGVKVIYQQPQLEALSFAMVIRNHAGPIFITFLVVLMVVSIALFLYRNVRVKRRVQPVISVLVGVLVGSFSWVFGMPLIFAIPFSLVIILVNLQRFRVCDACGRTVDTKWPFSSIECCSGCGVRSPCCRIRAPNGRC